MPGQLDLTGDREFLELIHERSSLRRPTLLDDAGLLFVQIWTISISDDGVAYVE